MNQHQSVTKNYALGVHAHVFFLYLARVHVRVIVLVVDVVCLMFVFSALVVLLALFIQFS